MKGVIMNYDAERIIVKGLIIVSMVGFAYAGFRTMQMQQQAELDQNVVQIRVAMSEAHSQGFMDGVIWAAQNPFPTNAEGKVQIDLKPIMDAQWEAWNRRQETVK